MYIADRWELGSHRLKAIKHVHQDIVLPMASNVHFVLPKSVFGYTIRAGKFFDYTNKWFQYAKESNHIDYDFRLRYSK